MESLTKIIAYGFILNGPDSYLRISWNVMDFIIVIFSVSVKHYIRKRLSSVIHELT